MNNVQQTLADIHMLVNYIKDHVDKDPVVTEITKLNEIGETTLKIAEILETVGERTGNKADEMLEAYKQDIGTAADKIRSQLKEIKASLDANQTLTNDLYKKIEEIYAGYTGILEQSTTKLELQRENYSREVRQLSSEVARLSDIAKALDQKTMTEERMYQMIEGLERQFTDILKQDAQLNDAYVKNAKQLETSVSDIRASYESLNNTLSSVDSSFKTAVSRLEVLLMQMDLLTKERRN